MNQYLVENSILYNSPVGKQITELRVAGDKLVLYTESDELYKRFKQWVQLIYMVPYTSGKNLVGADLYFPKTARKALIRALVTDPRTSKKGVPVR